MLSWCLLPGNVDRHGSRVFLLLTHSSSGGLPLGVIITSNEQEQTITEGLELLKTILPTGAFGGNGDEGPAVFITDDCSSERKALHSVFPKSTLLLCTFHLLQAVWRWLWDSKHGINKDHRQSLFFHVKQMMYASDPDAVEAAYQHARSDPTVIRWACLRSLNNRLECDIYTFINSLYSIVLWKEQHSGKGWVEGVGKFTWGIF